MMKRYYLICALLLIAGACSPGTSPASPTVAPTETRAPTPEPTATSVPIISLSLKQGEQYFAPASTFQISLGDLDDDGDLDAVAANMGSRNYSKVWLNDGSGYFEDSGQRLTDEGHGIGMGDLDGDGDLDLFITCADENKHSVIYLNDGGVQGGTIGDFQDTGQDLGDYTISANGIRLHDVDGDGDLDAFVVYYQVPDRIYLNDGAGYFADSGLVLPENSRMGDLDADGDLDVFAKELGIGYQVMLNDGGVQGGTPGNFTPHWRMEDSTVLYGGAAFGDLDADGDLDVMVANGDRDGNHPTRVFINDGSGQFTDSGQELGLTEWASISLADLNGNGYLDAFITNFGLPDQLWLNDGTGHFIDTGVALGGDAHTRGAALGDLDGDGDLDAFVADYGGGSSHIWFIETSSE